MDPRFLLVAGAVATSLTGVFIELSGVTPATSTFFRCVIALPVLGVLALLEYRRAGGVTRSVLLAQIGGGAMLGVDFALWARSIDLMGAGIATVVVNIQIVVVPLLAWSIYKVAIPVRFVATVPFLFAGIALAGGAFGGSGSSDQLFLGTLLALGAGVAYAIYIFVIGRAGSTGRASMQVLVTTASAGVVGTAVGSLWGTVDLTPGWPSIGWLTALSWTSGVLGWVLVNAALPKLPSEVGSAILLLQPISAVILAVVLLGERPSPGQIAGCVLVVACIRAVSRTSRVLDGNARSVTQS